ncbi:MAG: hypothetical protein ACOYMM_03320, partial [Phycisphaerales bacterium]
MKTLLLRSALVLAATVLPIFSAPVFGADASEGALRKTAGPLKIVSSLPRTGSANAQTTSMVNGIKM